MPLGIVAPECHLRQVSHGIVATSDTIGRLRRRQRHTTVSSRDSDSIACYIYIFSSKGRVATIGNAVGVQCRRREQQRQSRCYPRSRRREGLKGRKGPKGITQQTSYTAVPLVSAGVFVVSGSEVGQSGGMSNGTPYSPCF